MVSTELNVAINGNTYTEEQINAMDRASLRTIARILQETKFPDVSRAWIGSMASTSDLRDFVLGRPVKADHTGTLNGSASNGHGEPSAAALMTQAIALIAQSTRQGASKDELDALEAKIGRDVPKLVSRELAELRESLEAHFAELLQSQVTRVELVFPDGVTVNCDLQHYLFPVLAKMIGARVHVALVGPAGSGKTRAAHEIAQRLGLEFSAISVGPQTTQSQIMGYMDAQGRYVETEFRRRFEHGGVILLDEFDAANAGVGTCVNGATANDGCGFPDRYVLRHPDFVCICAMNTYGTGADRQYVGRNQLDAATLDRFAFVDWGYDEELELTLCTDKDWCKHVQKIRHAVTALKLRHVVSPRASFAGAKLLASGLDRETVENAVVWKGLAATEIAKVKGAI